METNEGLSPGMVGLREDELVDGFRIAPRTDQSVPKTSLASNPNPNSDSAFSNPSSCSSPIPSPSFNASAPAIVSLPANPDASVASSGSEVAKKKRGRPRKYGPDGTLVVTALSPMPISASIPLSGEHSAWKRGRGKAVETVKKQHKYDYDTTGDKIAYSVGANFTPHVLTVNTGEDITMKVMSFAQQGSRAICILSANGTISNVTLRQPNSSGGTLTYEGRFEILSLCGSFMPTDNGGSSSRSGGMSVALAGPDGRVVGGGLGGLLVAAGPVQVVVGSFLPGHQLEQKQKKQRVEVTPKVSPSVTVVSADAVVKPVAVPAADNTTSSADDDSRGLPSN